MRFRFLEFGPSMREKLGKLTGLHAIYASEDISQIVNRINIIAFARSDERKMSCRGHAASIRANKKAILAHQDKRLNSAFAGIIIYVKIRVIQAACQRKPMVERVVNSFHQGVGWIKSILKRYQLKVQSVY